MPLIKKTDIKNKTIIHSEPPIVYAVPDDNDTILYTYTRQLVKTSQGGYAQAYKFDITGDDMATKPTQIDGFDVCVGSTWFATDTGKVYSMSTSGWVEI